MQTIKTRINVYEIINGQVRIVNISCKEDLFAIKPIWIDFLNASETERQEIGQHYELSLPDPDDLTDLEVSARFYTEDSGEVHLHSNFLLDRENKVRSIPVAFIIHANILFTVRNQELPVFRLQRLRTRNQVDVYHDCKDILLDLYDADVEYSGDGLEDSYTILSKVSQKVLNETITDADAPGILSDIAAEENLNGLIRGNMLNTQRALTFLMRGGFLSHKQTGTANQIIRDIGSINSHSVFLFEKINFLMDATVGFVNVNQNKRISQLTIISVVFMPLNLLAGIGGMSEFTMMTKGVPWPVAYGYLGSGILLLGGLTYFILKLYEKRK